MARLVAADLSRGFLAVAALPILLLLPPSVFGQEAPKEPAWRALGPGSARISALWIDPDGELLAGTEDRGIFESNFDAGAWRCAGGPASRSKNGEIPIPVRSIFRLPESGTILAGTEFGLFRNTPGERAWFPVEIRWVDQAHGSRSSIRRNSSDHAVSVSAIAPLPGPRPTVFAATSAGLAESLDAGASRFRIARSGLPEGAATAVAVDAASPPRLFVATAGSLFVSLDRARSFSRVAEFPDATVVALAVDPHEPKNLYALTNEKLVRSSDDGRSWVSTSIEQAASPLLSIALDPTVPAIVYVGTERSGLFRSRDSGQSWSAAAADFHPDAIRAIAIDGIRGSVTWVATGGVGLLQGEAGGEQWTAQPIASALRVDRLLVDTTAARLDAKRGSAIVAASGERIFRTNDGGDSWTELASLPRGSRVSSWAAAAKSPSRWYLATASEMLRSDDEGSSWHPLRRGRSTVVRSIAIDPADSDRLFTATDQGLGQSIDGGVHWARVPIATDLRSITAVALDPSDALAIWVGGAGKLARTGNGGGTWNVGGNFGSLGEPTSIAIDQANPRFAVVATRGGRWFGALSTADDIGNPTLSLFGIALPVEPSTSGTHCFAGTTAPGAEARQAALRGAFVAFRGRRGRSSELIAARADGSVWLRRLDEGPTWALLGGRLPTGHLNDLAVDPQDGALYAATDDGVYRLDP